MLETRDLGHNRNIAAIAILSLLLGGCLMQEDVAEEEQSVSTVNTVEDEYELSGSVGDGPVVAAAMRVLQNDGVILAEFESDSSAGYNTIVKTKGKFYPLTIDAVGGTDLVTNQVPDFILVGAALEPSKKYVVNVNPFSTLAMEIARDLPGGQTRENIYAALDIIAASLHFGLASLPATAPMTTQIDSGNVALIIKSSEALGEVVRRTRDWLLNAGYVWNGDDVMRALGSDLIDGVIDGRGGPNVNARLAAIANLVIAQVLLESTANELHVNGADATASLESAIEVMNIGTASPTIAELTATSGMLEEINLRLAAADAISDDARVTALKTSAEGLQAGLQPQLAQSVLPADYQQTLDDTVWLMLSSGDATMIDSVNDVVRNGGTLPADNNPPQIAGTPGTAAEAGSMYQFQPSASDADGDLLTFSISNRPAWASFDTASGSLSGIPAESDVGNHAGIVISVSDGTATTSLAAFTISVSSAVSNTSPTISGSPSTSATVGSRYSFTPVASDADQDPLSFSISGIPSWAVFNSLTGELSGTPNTADIGLHANIVISVSDGLAVSRLPAFSINVRSAATNSPPVISGNPPSLVTANSSYFFAPTASDADNDPLTFSVTGLPVWATFDTDNGRISGVPSNAHVGTYSGIVITVSDGSASSSLPSFSITVQAAAGNAPPAISGTPPSAVTANTAYDFTPVASDADNDPLTFSVVGLPSWATFNSSTGRISGTPGDAHVGTYTGIAITVSDGQDSATLGPFSVTVEAVSLGSATLSWQPPTQNEDGTALTDLAGYTIYWGTTPGSYTESVTINNPGLTTYVVENLAPGTYEFVATAFNAAGVESQFSNTATKTVP